MYISNILSVSNLPEVPIGTIISWVLRVDKSGATVDLPDGWIRCDGSTVPSGSIWAGKKVPDLNGERRFLRGGPDEDLLTLEDDQVQDHHHTVVDPGHSHPYFDEGLSRFLEFRIVLYCSTVLIEH